MIEIFEDEVVEFKEARSNYSFKNIGKYFSALGNELKKTYLVEGRYPNLYVSYEVANITGQKTEYVRNK